MFRKRKEEKKEIPRKNVSYLLADVRHPVAKRSVARSKSEVRFLRDEAPKREVREIRSIPSKGKSSFVTAFSAIVAFTVVIGSVYGVFAKDRLLGSADQAYQGFLSAISSAKEKDAGGVTDGLESADQGLQGIESLTDFLKFIPLFREIPNFASTLRDTNLAVLNAMQEAENIKSNGLSWIFNDGEKLISSLKSIRQNLDKASVSGAEIRNKAALFGLAAGFSGEYISLQSDLSFAADALDGAIEILEGDNNFAIFFMNDSEIRATGGFIGSYAFVNIAKGEIKNLDVNDIYYPDKFMEAKTIPPKPLQAITTDWEARDANWFFDFPTSAKKVLGFMERSDIYSSKGTKFKGAIAMNHKVVTDILSVTGPIELPEYNTVLDETNFLEEVQKEVSRDSTIRGGERKNILKALLPELIARMKDLSATEKKEIISKISARLANKDIQIYIDDQNLEKTISRLGWSGEVYQAPEFGLNDYLAVVSSNIGGEKTDVYMRQKVSLESSIDESGTVKDKLTVTRIHNGDTKTLKFYNAPNQAYVRALVPQKTRLMSTAGGFDKKIASYAYEANGYSADTDVAAFEEGTESGKKVFGSWIKVLPGKEDKISFEYDRPTTFGNKFTFVYEKQASIDSYFSYKVTAPAGYIFKETKSSEFVYESPEPPSRLLIELTLARL